VIYAPIEWTEELTLGFAPIDEDHRTLVQMVNNIFLGICARLDDDILSTACDDLIIHTQGHFLREELAMERLFYSDLEGHKAEHAVLLDALGGALKTIIAISDKDQFFKAQQSLASWLTEHIVDHDKRTVDFILTQEKQQVA